jgi:hypothetical protein
MKASTHHKMPQKPTFKPKPLSVTQLNAIDALILGKTDQETADLVGVSRETVWGWRNEHLVFMACLQEHRAEVWRVPQERLRSLMTKAVENIAGLVETGDYEASIALLKITGMYGVVNVLGDIDPEKIIRTMAEAKVQREGIPRDATHEALVRLTQNTRYHERVQEIEAELRREYGEDCEGKLQ